MKRGSRRDDISCVVSEKCGIYRPSHDRKCFTCSHCRNLLDPSSLTGSDGSRLLCKPWYTRSNHNISIDSFYIHYIKYSELGPIFHLDLSLSCHQFQFDRKNLKTKTGSWLSILSAFNKEKGDRDTKKKRIFQFLTCSSSIKII